MPPGWRCVPFPGMSHDSSRAKRHSTSEVTEVTGGIRATCYSGTTLSLCPAKRPLAA